jgi:hypothetical protein
MVSTSGSTSGFCGVRSGSAGSRSSRSSSTRKRKKHLSAAVVRAWLETGLLAGGTALLIAFVLLEQTWREPLVRLGILRAPNLAAANLTMALLGAAWIPQWFFLNLYLQQVLGYDAFKSGAALPPITITILVLMVGLTGRLVPRLGPKPLLTAGLTALAGGIALFARTPAASGVEAPRIRRLRS